MIRLNEGTTEHTLDLSILQPDPSTADPQASLPLTLELQKERDSGKGILGPYLALQVGGILPPGWKILPDYMAKF